jgi:hypothetical protein
VVLGAAQADGEVVARGEAEVVLGAGEPAHLGMDRLEPAQRVDHIRRRAVRGEYHVDAVRRVGEQRGEALPRILRVAPREHADEDAAAHRGVRSRNGVRRRMRRSSQSDQFWM